MAKFTTDYVNLIANNLRDRYRSGFPILKELVQNADDAGARSLAFGYHPGFGPEADHDLLQGPALWVLNDGAFLSRDREAIQSFGLNGKAADAAVIGKFGLGMKSVFHLCESFFYLASDGQETYREILNPWMQDVGSLPMHERWEHISERDLQCLLGVAREQPEVQPARSWFLLWVPLRCRTHVASEEGRRLAAIIERFPGDSSGQDLDFFTEEGIDRRIGGLLPMLRNLERVRFGGTSALRGFNLRLDAAVGSLRLDHVTDQLELRGVIDDGRSRSEQLKFVARQRVLRPDQPFASALEAQGWPKTMAIVGDGVREQVSDKARPEGAVMVACADGRAGRLVLQWAVFLPTEEVRFAYEVPIADSSREYRIVLHGQFFVDAGRRGIGDMDVLHESLQHLALDAPQSEVVKFWNQAIAQHLVLPLLPEAIARFVELHGLKDPEISALTKAVAACSATADAGVRVGFYSTFRQYICRDHVWIRRLRRAGAEWALVRADAGALLPLPSPPVHDPERPWRVLPGLDGLRQVTYVDREAPRLAWALGEWSEAALLSALRTSSPQSLASQTDLEYLVRFLEPERERLLRIGQVHGELSRLIRRGITALSLGDLRQQRSHFKALVGLLPNDRVFAIGTRDPRAIGAIDELLYKQLLACETHALMLPADLAPDGAAGSASHEDLVTWLRSVARLPDGRMQDTATSVDPRLRVAEELIRAAGDPSGQLALLRQVPALPVLRATRAKDQAMVAVSIESLAAVHESGLLFKVTNAADPLGHVPKLAMVMPAAAALVVRAQVAAVVTAMADPASPDVPSSQDPTAMLAAVGRSDTPPTLGVLASRKELLALVPSAELKNAAVVRGARYLLHGTPEHYLGSEPLWKDPAGQRSPWVKLWRMIAESSWNVLPAAICDAIPDGCLDALNIRVVDEGSVLNRLRVCRDFSRVDASEFSPADLDLLLGRVADEHPWRQLPLHRDSEGHFGPIDGNCYLGTQPPLPETIDHRLRFVVQSQDPAHSRNQQLWIPIWSPRVAAEAVLRCVESASVASRHWRYLLDLLGGAADLQSHPTAAWMKTRWVPLASGRTISLDSLIRIDGLEGEIAQLAIDCDFVYAGVDSVESAVHEHPAWPHLLRQIASGAAALPVLGMLMVEAGMRLGSSLCDAYTSGRSSLGVLSKLASVPGWVLVQKCVASIDEPSVREQLIPHLRAALPPEQAERALRDLYEGDNSSSLQRLTQSVLEEWAGSDTADRLRERMRALKLPSLAGPWRSASELAVGLFGVDPRMTLDPTAAERLRGIVIENSATPTSAVDRLPSDTSAWDERSLIGAVEGMFEPLSQSSVREAVGAVIGLFGSSVESLAKEWLGPINYADYLALLGWREPGYENGPDRRLAWMGGMTIEKALSSLKFTVREDDGRFVEAESLVGTPIKVPLLPVADAGTLLVGQLWWQGDGVVVSLRPPLTLLDCDVQEQRKILQRTAETILAKVYNQPHVNLDALWSRFAEADQITLGVARTMILDVLHASLRTLPGVGKHSKIGAALSRFDQARRALSSAMHSGQPTVDRQRDVQAASADLATLVETDREVQEVILEGVRERVRHNQYDITSIPFEIFQNADDAVGELQRLQEAEGRARFQDVSVGRFVADVAGHAVRFVHWGRPVNYAGRRGAQQADYANDLERMLMLGASSKDDEQEETGKFGLGFKSTLLASDSPRVLSADLSFEVTAGLLPQKWTPDREVRAFVEECQRQAPGALRPTLVELPVRSGVAPAEMISRFVSLSGVLAVFARNVRHIDLGVRVASWLPRRIVQLPTCHVEVGSTSLPAQSGVTEARMLVLRSSNVAAALRIDPRGVIPFDSGAAHPVPAIWVTAPTRGQAAHGVALNAPFVIDTGRATLASGPNAAKNREIAAKLATDVLPSMLELYARADKDWPSMRDTLGCSQVETQAQFWFGFWKHVFGSAPDDDASADRQLIEKFACTLFDRLAQKPKAVPNGLPGTLNGFVDPASVSLVIDVQRYRTVIPRLVTWIPFVERYPLDSWCDSTVVEWLRRSGCFDDDDQPTDLALDALLTVLQHGRLPLDQVDALAAILIDWPKGTLEDQGWRSQFAKLQFRTAAGTWRTAEQLVRDSMPDADLLQGFAPKDCVLDPDYQQTRNWQTLDAILPRFEPEVSRLVAWCIDARGAAAQAPAAGWMLRNHYTPVVDHIRWRAAGSRGWIDGLNEDHAALKHLPAEDRRFLLTKLGIPIDDEAVINGPQSVPRFDLWAISRWWAAVRAQELPRYLSRLWPSHVRPERLAEDDLDRSTWMALFSLALFRRYGRVTDDQHRGFLEFLHRNGWWSTICDVEPDRAPERWISILREYGEKQSAEPLFEQWMDSFPRLYRVARWLPQYAHVARTLDQREHHELANWLSPSADHVLSGSGIDAPTLGGMLRLGQHLLVRELLRVGVLQRSVAKPLAYMPTSGLVELLAQMGHVGLSTSADIYRTLVTELGEEAADFDGDFDIPLQILATDASLRAEVEAHAALAVADEADDEAMLDGAAP